MIFTESAHWADLVQQLRCPPVVICCVLCVVCCPLPMQFFSVDQIRIFAWTESSFWWGSGPHGALKWSPKNRDVFRIQHFLALLALFRGFSTFQRFQHFLAVLALFSSFSTSQRFQHFLAILALFRVFSTFFVVAILALFRGFSTFQWFQHFLAV